MILGWSVCTGQSEEGALLSGTSEPPARVGENDTPPGPRFLNLTLKSGRGTVTLMSIVTWIVLLIEIVGVGQFIFSGPLSSLCGGEPTSRDDVADTPPQSELFSSPSLLTSRYRPWLPIAYQIKARFLRLAL